MSKIVFQNYSYAKDSSGELINISKAQREKRYFCPMCGSMMIPHMGKVRRWHFVHKNVENCSYESYLHKLAKLRIKEAFLTSEHFSLSYKAKALCSYPCPFVGSQKCEDEKSVEFDLRDYYDKCEIEAQYHQYRADLLLSSSVKPNLPPILIEIMVTHKCSEEKIRDGVRIIEIPIHSEEQIDNIVNNCKIDGVRNGNERCNRSTTEPIILYNFNKFESFDPVGSFDKYKDCFNRKGTFVFWINQEGQFQSFFCHCYEVNKLLPKKVHYFITEIATSFKEIFKGFSQRGVNIRNCFLCKYSQKDNFDERICVLYKKYGLPRKPSPNNAMSCSYYKEDMEQLPSLNPIGIDAEAGCEKKCYYHICKEIL